MDEKFLLIKISEQPDKPEDIKIRVSGNWMIKKKQSVMLDICLSLVILKLSLFIKLILLKKVIVDWHGVFACVLILRNLMTIVA